jgi:hypothetical protein
MRLKLLSICVGLLCGGTAQAGSTAIYEFSDRYEVLFYKGCPESQAWRCGLFALGCRKQDSWRTFRAFVHRLGPSDVAQWLIDGATTSIDVDGKKADLETVAIEPSRVEKLWSVVYEPVELLQWMGTATNLQLKLGSRQITFVLDAMDRQNVGKAVATCFSPGAAGLVDPEELRHLYGDRDRLGRPSPFDELRKLQLVPE